MAASGGLLTGAAGVPNSTLCGPNLMTETGKFYAVFHTKFLAPARADKLTIKCMDFRSAGDTTVTASSTSPESSQRENP